MVVVVVMVVVVIVGVVVARLKQLEKGRERLQPSHPWQVSFLERLKDRVGRARDLM